MTLSGSFGTPSNPHSFAFQRVDQVGLPREHDPYAFFPDDADVDRRDHHRFVVGGEVIPFPADFFSRGVVSVLPWPAPAIPRIPSA
jgi:hypothetical protein